MRIRAGRSYGADKEECDLCTQLILIVANSLSYTFIKSRNQMYCVGFALLSKSSFSFVQVFM